MVEQCLWHGVSVRVAKSRAEKEGESNILLWWSWPDTHDGKLIVELEGRFKKW